MGQPLGETPGPQLDRRTVAGERESAARSLIADGTRRMPGFRHALRPAQVDRIVAYLRTVPESTGRTRVDRGHVGLVGVRGRHGG